MLKKIIVFALVLTLSVGMLSSLTLFASAETPTYDGGSGRATDPYIISTKASLKALAEAVNGGANQAGVYFELGSDITLTEDWTPIGTTSSLGFKGSFNGAGFEIRGMNITSEEYDCIGLFGALNTKAVVKNVTVSGNITGTAAYIGGIVGLSYGASIQNCVSNVEIDAKANGTLPCIGGIVGTANDMSVVEYCVNNGNIKVALAEMETPITAILLAGIAGQLHTFSDVKYCINKADLELTNINTAYVGGIVGRATGGALTAGVVESCASIGNLKADDGVTTGCVGGVVSYLHLAGYTINNCGFVGTISTPIDATTNEMKTTYLGYLVGNSKNLATITNCKVSGDVLLAGASTGNNTPIDCVTGVTEIDSLVFSIEDAIKAWAKADEEAVVTDAPTAEVTTAKTPDDNTSEVPNDDTTAKTPDNTTKTPDNTTKAPVNTTTSSSTDDGGCGGIGIAQTIAVFVALFGGAAAFVKVKKNG